ncbi:NAD(P)H-dependent oxidoreductase, partial [Streptococcus suis]
MSVFANPRKEIFTQALVDIVAEALLENGAQVVIRDLYEIVFDPVLRGEDTIHIDDGKFVRQATVFPADV